MSSPLAAIIYLGVISLQGAMSCSDSIVPRSTWKARTPVAIDSMTLPVPFVVVHHTYIPAACNTTAECEAAMRAMQDFHQLTRGWNDIGYNFCVGGDGKVYEGRGWERVGAHAPKYNFMSIGICLIGDYRSELPPAAMINATHALIACGVALGHINASYELVGHRQVRDTECPGGALFNEIKTWPRWRNITDIQPYVVANLTTTTTLPEEATTLPEEATTTEHVDQAERVTVQTADDDETNVVE